MLNLRVWFPQGLLFLCSFVSCTGVTPVPSDVSLPLFTPTAEDTTRLAKLTHQLDNRALECLEVSSCEEVHFTRALVSLFENQEAARASFRQVIEHNPASPLATTSQQWLRLIRDHEAVTSPCPSTDIVAEFLRDWMERQVTADRPAPLTTEDTLDEQTRVVNGVVQVLDKQVRERDRRIAILQSKLEALKVIDEDHEKRKRAIRLPATSP